MRKKLIFVAGLGVGYVLGAKAGRERYEQIVRASRKFAEHPTVQETTGLIQAKTGSLVNTAKDIVASKVGNTKLGAKVNGILGGSNAPEVNEPKKALELEAAVRA